MATLDWIFCAVLLVSLALGVWRGLVYEVLSVVSWVLAFFVAQWAAPDLAHKLPLIEAAETVRYVIAFVLVFVVAVFAGGLLAALAKKLFSAAGLQPVDRALGAGFGLVRGVLILLLATLILAMTPASERVWWRESSGVEIALAALEGLRPMLPPPLGKYLP